MRRVKILFVGLEARHKKVRFTNTLYPIMIALKGLHLYCYIILADMIPIIIVWLVLGIFFLLILKHRMNELRLKLLQIIYSSNFGKSTNNKEKAKSKKDASKKDYKEKEKEGKDKKFCEDKVSFKLTKEWITLKLGNDTIYFPSVLNGFVTLLLYCVCATSFAVFWDSTIVKTKVDNCLVGEGFDCFLRDSRLSAEPLNCSNYEDPDSGGVICLRLQWDVTQGMTDAGGMFTASTIILGVAVTAILQVKRFLIRLTIFCCCKKCCYKCYYGTKHYKTIEKVVIGFMFTIQLVCLIAVTGVIFLLFAYAPVWNYLRYNSARMMKTLCFIFSLLILTNVPWYFCFIEYGTKNDKTEKSKGE